MPKTKVLSLFSGAGGFELGLNDNFELVGLSEIDKYASAVLKHRWPKVTNYGDVTKIKPSNLPDFELLIGGSPCQSFSIAGNREGLKGKSGLFYSYLEILKEKRPKSFIWENVKGTLSSTNGWDFAFVQMELAEIGYDIRWEVLNAKDFSVPQNRERVFIVGHNRTDYGAKVLSQAGSGGTIGTPKQGTKQKESSTQDIKLAVKSHGKLKQTEIANCIDANYFKGVDNHGQRTIVCLNPKARTGDRVYSPDGVSPSLQARTANNNKGSKLIAYSKSTRTTHIDHRARIDDTANTLNTGDGCRSQSSGNFVDSNTKIRRLTPKECERLMSWPEDHTKYGSFYNVKTKTYETKEISDTQRYKMCGNGVVSNCIKAIIEVL